jgi:radical SAM protein with 4Fe4S-binding SPASM domain
VTTRCNLACRHCYNSSSSTDPSPDHLHHIAEELAGSQIFFASLSGGEPLMEPAIWEIISIFKEKKKFIQLISNGTLITRSIAKKIKDYGVDSVQISLDGLKDTHEFQRGVRGCFSSTCQSIQHLLSEEVPVTVNTLVTQHNRGEIHDIVQLLMKMGVREYRTTRLILMGRGEALHREVLTPQQTRNLIQNVLQLRTRYAHTIAIIPDECMSFVGEDITEYGLTWYGCPAGRTECAVDDRGDVYPCVFLTHDDFYMGTLENTSFDEIWHGDSFARFREIERTCNCSISEFCKGGCMAAAYARYGDIYRKDPYCWRNEHGKR